MSSRTKDRQQKDGSPLADSTTNQRPGTIPLETGENLTGFNPKNQGSLRPHGGVSKVESSLAGATTATENISAAAQFQAPPPRHDPCNITMASAGNNVDLESNGDFSPGIDQLGQHVVAAEFLALAEVPMHATDARTDNLRALDTGDLDSKDAAAAANDSLDSIHYDRYSVMLKRVYEAFHKDAAAATAQPVPVVVTVKDDEEADFIVLTSSPCPFHSGEDLGNDDNSDDDSMPTLVDGQRIIADEDDDDSAGSMPALVRRISWYSVDDSDDDDDDSAGSMATLV